MTDYASLAPDSLLDVNLILLVVDDTRNLRHVRDDLLLKSTLCKQLGKSNAKKCFVIDSVYLTKTLLATFQRDM